MSQSLGRKNGSGWEISNSYEQRITNSDNKCFGTVSNLKGYHVYQGIRASKIRETLSTEREPGNPKDKYAVCVKKNECIAGHLPLSKTVNFAKTMFYF